MGEFGPDGEGKPQMIRIVMRKGDTADYWEGE
jgi:hypothetical protein